MSLVGAIDQGTSSSRFLVFDPKDESVVSQSQLEFSSSYPHEGWIEQEPEDLLQTVKQCISNVFQDLKRKGLETQLKAIGITNQRETTIAWDRETGKALYKAIVWCDARTQATVHKLIREKGGAKGQDVLRDKCGLPLSTYFSAVKLRWMLDHVNEVKEAADDDRLCFGTVDSWLLWHLTSGDKSQNHLTDVTNASRTMLMNLKTLEWDDDLLAFFGFKKSFLPKIVSSAEHYGNLNYPDSPWPTVSICGCLGDQQAALVGHHGFRPGMAKNTYGTGCFLLYNVGTEIVASSKGMLSTLAYQFGPKSKPVYALEGSIAVAGSAVAWLRDNLNIIKESKEIEQAAGNVSDCGGVYFVPAFSGLFAPHWRPDARGTICGLTQYSNKDHICRAVLEAVCFQTRELLEAMNEDSGIDLHKLLVDGGMTRNNLMMQIQADFLEIDVVRPANIETTALGAAIAAGHAAGVWTTSDSDDHSIKAERVFQPSLDSRTRQKKYDLWKKAVYKSLDWDSGEEEEEN